MTACRNVDPEYFKEETKAKVWESACCHLSSVPRIFFTSPLVAWALIIDQAIAGTDEAESLNKKCKEAKFHTGGGKCILHEDRPDGVKDCCYDNSERDITGMGEKCKIKTYTGSDSCKADGVFSCCVCIGTDGKRAIAAGGEPKNCKSCTQLCEDAKSNGVGAGGKVSYQDVAFTAGGCNETAGSFTGMTSKQYGTYKAGQRKRGEDVNVFCWTAKECQDANGKFRAGEGCKNKGKEAQGKCEAPEPDYELQYPVMGVTSIKGLRSFIGLMFTAGIAFAVIAAAIAFVYGAFKYMVSAISSQISRAKETMIDALIGMVLALGSYVILANVAPNTLKLNAFKIDMINRMSFYSVVYCSDITAGPKEAAITFQDAGDPVTPKSFDITQGYTIPLDKTVCGNEYFISGGNQDSICMGKTCEKGAKCLNCASALASGCKTKSPHEFKCTNARMGGNVTSPAKWKPDKIWLEWYGVSKQSLKFYNFSIDEFNFASEQVASVGASNASGFASSYRFTKANPEYIKKYFEDKEKEGYRSGGMLLILAIINTDIVGADQYVVFGKSPVDGKCTWVDMYFGGAVNCLTPGGFPCTLSGNLDDMYKNNRKDYDWVVSHAILKDDLSEESIDKIGACDIKINEQGLGN